jgi:Na+/H+-translocating membrane pyrophosphatase
VKNWYLFVCVASGLWGGLFIGLQTEYFTSNRYKPVQVGAGAGAGRARGPKGQLRGAALQRAAPPSATPSSRITNALAPPPPHPLSPQDVADACRTGPATDIIFGLALGYKSTIIPCFVIATCIYIGNTLGGMLGIACAALGMLSTLSTGLAIDA